MTRADVAAILRAANPTAPASQVEQYAAAWLEFRHADAKITALGTVIAHPRTGAPIDNPYLRIRAQAAATMAGLGEIRRADELWRLPPDPVEVEP